MSTTTLGARATLFQTYQPCQFLRLSGSGSYRQAASFGELAAAAETPIFADGSTVGPFRVPTVVSVQAGDSGCTLTSSP